MDEDNGDDVDANDGHGELRISCDGIWEARPGVPKGDHDNSNEENHKMKWQLPDGLGCKALEAGVGHQVKLAGVRGQDAEQ